MSDSTTEIENAIKQIMRAKDKIPKMKLFIQNNSAKTKKKIF